MWATVLGVHYIIVNVIWFLQKFYFHSHSVYWDAHQRLKLGLGSRSTAVARKCQNINIITKHKHYFQIQIFHKSISYLLESMFKCKIKFEDIIVFSFKGLAILGCIYMHYNAAMDDSLWYDITTMELYYTI